MSSKDNSSQDLNQEGSDTSAKKSGAKKPPAWLHSQGGGTAEDDVFAVLDDDPSEDKKDDAAEDGGDKPNTRSKSSAADKGTSDDDNSSDGGITSTPKTGSATPRKTSAKKATSSKPASSKSTSSKKSSSAKSRSKKSGSTRSSTTKKKSPPAPSYPSGKDLSVEDSRQYNDDPLYNDYSEAKRALAARREGLTKEPLMYHDFSAGRNLTVYADVAVRDEVKDMAFHHGLSLSVLINALLKRFLREGPSLIEE